MRRVLVAGLAGLLALSTSRAVAHADSAAPLTGVEPVAVAGGLGCRVQTIGLPDEQTLKSMQGGLPSALSVIVELVDDHDQPLRRQHYSLRLAFDLWDEVFHLDGPGLERRFSTVDSLRSALRELGPFPVGPLTPLARGERYRLRVELLEYLIAPSQRARIGELLAGETPASGAAAGAGEEMLLGFGRLIQFVYGRDRARDVPRHVAWSPWFTPEALAGGSP